MISPPQCRETVRSALMLVRDIAHSSLCGTFCLQMLNEQSHTKKYVALSFERLELTKCEAFQQSIFLLITIISH